LWQTAKDASKEAMQKSHRPRAAAAGTPPEEVNAKPQRRRQEDRVRDTREKILNATIEVLVRDGFGRLSLREVATVADVSYGALVHHFAAKEDLTVAATDMVYEEAIARTVSAAGMPDAVKSPLQAYIADSLRLYFDWPFLAALEILMSARSDKPLLAKMLPIMERHRRTCDTLWLDVFVASGMTAETARLILNLTLNIVRGMAVNRVWKHDDSYYQRYLAEWTEVANGLIHASLEKLPSSKK